MFLLCKATDYVVPFYTPCSKSWSLNGVRTGPRNARGTVFSALGLRDAAVLAFCASEELCLIPQMLGEGQGGCLKELPAELSSAVPLNFPGNDSYNGEMWIEMLPPLSGPFCYSEQRLALPDLIAKN